MRITPLQLLSLGASLVLAPFASAHSHIRNPLGAISAVQNATIHTHNGMVHALSEFDLTFNIRNDVHVKLSLKPNHDILGEGATVAYLGPDGTVSRTETIDRMAHRVFLGTAWVQRPSIGQERYQPVGWARLVVTRDGRQPSFEGSFAVGLDHHHIQTSRNYARTRHELDPVIEVTEHDQEYMVVWRDSDILPSLPELGHQDLRRGFEADLTCQSDGLHFNVQPDHPVYLGEMKRDSFLGSMDFTSMFTKRQVDSTTGGNSAGVNLANTIGQTAGCPTTRKVALVGLALDCNYISDFNSTDSAKSNALSQINQASAVWEKTFNISLTAGNLVLGNEHSCPGTPAQATLWDQRCSDSVDISARLNYFSAWRGLQHDNFSHWTLLSTCNTGSAVGLAWLGQACVQSAMTNPTSSSTGNGASSDNETVSGANVIVRTQGASEWQIIAHETGHTYGAVHDCYSATCADQHTVSAQQCCPLSSSVCDANQKYIMNPSTAQGISDFSMCSVGNICSAMGRNSVNSGCLTSNRQVTTVGEPQCGNGIVEAGEDCDCGGEAGCSSDKCCNPTTCKFTTGAVCDDANEDCCRNCQFASNGTVCRASTGSCDPAEVCSGTSPACPADVTTPDGDSCGNGLTCASGQCTSRDQQCKTVMGSYTQGNDTYSCDASSCTISCGSPEFGYGVCYGLQQNFLDGTKCNGNGHCKNGQCQGGNAFTSWIDEHKAIVIGICSAIGALLLFAVLGCLGRCCTRRRRTRQTPGPPPPPPPRHGWHAVPPPPPMQQRPRHRQPASQDWFVNQPGSGPPQGGSHMGGGWVPPTVPPRAYPPRGNSVRYA